MQETNEILEHGQDYDGIKEYDNPLPQWFMVMFYISIAFAFLYMGYYTGKSYGLVHATPVSQNLAWSGAVLAEQMRAVENAKLPFEEPKDHEALESFLRTPGNISKGEAIFKANCVACHGEQAQGIVGPNLTDKFWLHGGKSEDIVLSITGGWVAKGMPSWGPVLGPEKIHWVAAYVLSLKGKPVTNPKAPQGVEETE